MHNESLPAVDVKAWKSVQDGIWACELCRKQPRVACDQRQKAEAPGRNVKLLLVGVAPPHAEGITTKTQARSATNNLDDNLRKFFILASLPLTWEDLLSRGMLLIHAVKCAITPKDRHQDPP